ncbi:MAG: hypothetical protein J7L92_06875, partial [Dehalococcoidia bacterium]|nr:hypothetical protein [Dehalococcoidia bacterium]
WVLYPARFKIGGDRIVVAHGDVGRGSVDVSNDAHIAGPVAKLVALLSLGYQVYHCSLVIGKSPFSRRGYRTSSGAGDSEGISRLTSAYHPHN